jgi:hypothetical protein
MRTDGSVLKDTLLSSMYSAMKLAEGANCIKLMKCEFYVLLTVHLNIIM